MTEIILGGIFLYICKEDSRNAFNNDRAKLEFATNFETLFGMKLPHMDTIDAVLRVVENDEIEQLKAGLIASLIEKKVFGKYRLKGAYRVAVDATGVMTVSEGHCPHCLHKKSKNGTITYFHNILEAKIITPNGFAISLASEWIENQDIYDKQDCEQKAFKRLAEKIKKLFPRLPICILADGLYPNAPFFSICRDYNWRFIVTLKDGSLKALWEQIDLELLMRTGDLRSNLKPQQKEKQTYRWLSGLTYQGHVLSWIECLEENGGKVSRFVYLTDIEAKFNNVIELVTSGRMRFKIENEGFNTQKNGGYNLSHKFSRVSAVAMKNYISLMQIAHLLNQLYELSPLGRALLIAKETLKNLWKDFISTLTHTFLDRSEVIAACLARVQIRFE